MNLMSVSQAVLRFKNAALLIVSAEAASAHASDQGLVLLLPTGIYTAAGASAVALTVLLMAVLPNAALTALFRPLLLMRWQAGPWPLVTSGFSCALLFWLVWMGLNGSRDPLSNPLPLMIWTIWWVGLVSLQGLFGNLWRWLNPWSGAVALARLVLGAGPLLRLPGWLGHAPALVIFLGFAAFLMADPAPADPARLARVVGAYWVVSFAALIVFGPRWARRGEGLSVLMQQYARVAVFSRRKGRLAAGLSGWQVLAGRVPPLGLAVFALIMLGSGSFDGLNETFWWLGVLGINPLEFPGRSAVVTQNFVGLLLANLMLAAIFAVTIWAGLRLSRSDIGLSRAVRIFAPTILPIALGYHVAHYLPSFLVESQYALAALNDPLVRGDDLLGLGIFYVTTGFFNTPSTVRLIFLSQAGAVVVGHVLAVMLAHGAAARLFGDARRAVLGHAPLAIFMIGYTFFGLWLLASPRGV